MPQPRQAAAVQDHGQQHRCGRRGREVASAAAAASALCPLVLAVGLPGSLALLNLSRACACARVWTQAVMAVSSDGSSCSANYLCATSGKLLNVFLRFLVWKTRTKTFWSMA